MVLPVGTGPGPIPAGGEFHRVRPNRYRRPVSLAGKDGDGAIVGGVDGLRGVEREWLP